MKTSVATTAVSKPPCYCVPRRFGMAAIMVGVTLFSLLVVYVSTMSRSPAEIAIVVTVAVGFISSVALAQMFMFGGRRPRCSSMIAGASAFGFLNAIPPLVDSLNVLLALIVFIQSAFWGAAFGYLAGGILAGIFLVLDYIESWLTGKPRQMPGEEQAPAAAVEAE